MLLRAACNLCQLNAVTPISSLDTPAAAGIIIELLTFNATIVYSEKNRNYIGEFPARIFMIFVLLVYILYIFHLLFLHFYILFFIDSLITFILLFYT